MSTIRHDYLDYSWSMQYAVQIVQLVVMCIVTVCRIMGQLFA